MNIKDKSHEKETIEILKKIIAGDGGEIMYRSKLVRSLACKLNMEENSASRIVDVLEKEKLIKYTGELKKVENASIMARQLIITELGEEVIRNSEIYDPYKEAEKNVWE